MGFLGMMAFTAALGNDAFSDAEVIEALPVFLPADTEGATLDEGELPHGGLAINEGGSVWWRWEATEDSVMSFIVDSARSGKFWGLTIYRGDALGFLEVVEEVAGWEPSITFSARAGHTYYIAVGGYTDYDRGRLTLIAGRMLDSDNDSWLDPQWLSTSQRVSVVQSNLEATVEDREGGVGTRTLWYAWRAPSSGQVVIDAQGFRPNRLRENAFTPLIGIASPFSGAQEAEWATLPTLAPLTMTVVEGQNLQILVASLFDGERGDIHLTLTHAPSPPNETVERAIDLGSLTAYRTALAPVALTAENERGFATNFARRRDAWWRWEAPFDGLLEIETVDSTLFGQIASGDSPAFFRLPAQPFDGLFSVEQGEIYWIQLHGRNSSSREWTDFEIHASPLETTNRLGPEASAELTTERSISVDARDEERAAWWHWTAPADTFVSATVRGANGNRQILQEMTVTTHGEIVGSTSFSSPAEFFARAGVRYDIQIDLRGAGDAQLFWDTREAGAHTERTLARELPSQMPLAVTDYLPWTNLGKLWYRWTAPESGEITLQFPSPHTFDIIASAFDARSGESIASGIGGLTFRAQANRIYEFSVQVASLHEASFVLTMAPAATTLSPEEHDAFEKALDLGEADFYRREGDPTTDLWWKWQAPSGWDGLWLETQGGGGDLTAYQGTGPDELKVVGGPSEIGFPMPVTPGDVYYIQLGKGPVVDSEPYTLLLAGYSRPPNDDRAKALDMAQFRWIESEFSQAPSELHVEEVLLEEATWEPGEIGSALDRRGSLWWRWQPEEDYGLSVRAMGVKVRVLERIDGLDLIIGETEESEMNVPLRKEGTYHVQITSDRNTRGAVLLHRSARPKNDDFAEAIDLGEAWEIESASNSLGATTERLEPDHHLQGSLLDGKSSVWWRWQAPDDVQVTLATQAGLGDAIIAVYEGNQLPSLTPVVSALAEPQVRFQARAGETYHFAIMDNIRGLGTVLSLQLEAVIPPVNDHFENALDVTSETAIDVTGTLAGASLESFEIDQGVPPGASVWYRWIAPHGGRLLLQANSGLADAEAFAAYTTEPLPSQRLALQVFRPSGVILESVRAGDMVHIGLQGSFRAPGEGAFSFRLQLDPFPDNNRYRDARDLGETIAFEDTATNVGATVPEGVNAFLPRAGGQSIWWKWQAPQDGAMSLQARYADETPGDLFVAVYQDESLLNHNTGAVGFHAEAGTVYHFRIDTSSKGALEGLVALSGNLFDLPSNDLWGQSVDLRNVDSLTLSVNNIGATAAFGDPPHQGRDPQHTVWWKWTPEPGDYEIIVSDHALKPALYRAHPAAGPWIAEPLEESEPFARHGHHLATIDLEITYFLAFDTTTQEMGLYEAQIRKARIAPSNDTLQDAEPLESIPPGMVEVMLDQATRQSIEPKHRLASADPRTPRHSVWYLWTPLTDGVHTFAARAEFPIVVAIYEQRPLFPNTVGPPVALLSDSSDLTQLTFEAHQNVTYQIALAAFEDVGTAPVALSFSEIVVSPTDPRERSSAALTILPNRQVIHRRRQDPAIRYIYESSSDLQTWKALVEDQDYTVQILDEGDASDTERIALLLNDASRGLFVRVKVSTLEE